VAQEVTLTFGCAHAAEVPLDAVESVAETLAEEHGLTTMLTTLSATGAAPEVFPRFEEPPVPVSFTLGPRDVKTAGLAHASHPPVAWSPRRLGPPAAPALHYALGAGTAAAWADLRALTAHLSRGGRGLPEPGRA
jgi:hypothetical protein